jgi:hypothetical protein
MDDNDILNAHYELPGLLPPEADDESQDEDEADSPEARPKKRPRIRWSLPEAIEKAGELLLNYQIGACAYLLLIESLVFSVLYIAITNSNPRQRMVPSSLRLPPIPSHPRPHIQAPHHLPR